MTRKIRFIWSGIAIIAFLILAPLLVLSSMGYRFGGKEIKTIGMIYLRSTPTKADVYINGQLFKEKTPAAITDLEKNDYEIKVQKEGFYEWKKKLSVFPNMITEAREIYLLSTSLNPKLITTHTTNFYKLSPSQEKIAYITQDKETRGIWVLNLNDLNKVQVFSKLAHRNLEVPENFEWSSDSKKILFLVEPERKLFKNAPQKYFVVDIEKPTEILDLSTYLLDKKIIEPRWYPDDPNRISYTTIDKKDEIEGVFELNLASSETKEILESNIISYVFTNNEIYFIKKITSEKTEKTEFWKANLDGSNPLIITEAMPQNKDYQLLLSTNKDILLFSPSINKLYLFNQSQNQFEPLEDNATEAKWSPNGKYVLYLKNGREIWVYNFKNKKSVFLKPNEKMLVTKYADPIQEIAWFSTSEHIIFRVNNEIKIIEVDPRGGANLNKIADSDSSQNFNVGKNGESLYFTKKVDDNEKIYEIFLTEKEFTTEIIR